MSDEDMPPFNILEALTEGPEVPGDLPIQEYRLRLHMRALTNIIEHQRKCLALTKDVAKAQRLASSMVANERELKLTEERLHECETATSNQPANGTAPTC